MRAPPPSIAAPEGKLAVLLPGLGAVATTFIAGTMLARKGLAKPVGSLTQMGTIRLGKRSDARTPLVRDFLPLAPLNDLVFGGWDIFPDTALESARHAGVLEEKHLTPVADDLSSVTPMAGAFYPNYVKRLHGTHVKTAKNKAEMVE